MAGLSSLPGVRDQIALVARLRWLLFRNSLRTLRGRLEAVSIAIVSVMMGVFALGAGVGFGVGAFALVKDGRIGFLGLLLWGIFLFWQLYPLFMVSAGGQFDFGGLLRFPLRYSAFFILSLAYGLFDPGAVISIFWLASMELGIFAARPSLGLGALPTLALFAGVNLLLARMILAWLERWLAQRRTREALGFVFLLFLLGFQFIGPLFERFGRPSISLGHQFGGLIQAAQLLPPGLAAMSLTRVASGQILRAMLSLALLAVWGLIFFWLLNHRLHAQYWGENLGESVAPALHALPGKVHPAWELPFVPRASAAVFEKEMRYLFRSGPALLQLVIPVIIVLFFGFGLEHGEQGHLLTSLPDMIFPIAAGYAFLIQTNAVFNSFAFDGAGIQCLLLAPVHFREILFGKNLFQGILMLVETCLVGICVSLLFRPPSVTVVAATFAALFFASPANYAAGNMLSLMFPRRFEFGMFRQKRVASLTMAVSLGMQALLLGICGVIFALSRLFGHMGLAIFIFLALSAGTWWAYSWSLGRADTVASERRETLVGELCRQE